MNHAATVAAITAVVGSVPVSALCALIYRFPIPFAGYESGPDAAVATLSAALLYGVLMGGFVGLAVLGAAVGAITSRLAEAAGDATSGRTDAIVGLFAGLGTDVIVIGLLANWDTIYGPW